MSALLPLAFAIPLVAAAAGMLMTGSVFARRVISLAGSGAVLAIGVTTVVLTADGEVLVHTIGGFPGAFAISYVVDAFAALMLTVAGLMVVACTAFAIASREDQSPFFHPLVSVLLAGITGAFMTADLFNLFVSFEIMLIASYVLLVLRGGARHVRAGAVYVMTNLLATTALVGGIALLYGTSGSVNIAVLADGDAGQVAVPLALILTAFAVKAGLAPLHGWLVRAYPDTSPTVAALFSGLLTKVGIYAIMRVASFLTDDIVRPVWLVVACVTMVVGVVAAVSQTQLRRILSFSIVSHVGYMILGLGLISVIGLAGAIFYVIHHIIVKTSLFLSAAAVERLHGHGRLEQLGGLVRSHPVLAATFGVAALSLAGVPPLSGFAAKLILIQAAFVDGYEVAGFIALLVGLVTLAAMVKIWNGAFWGEFAGHDPHVEEDGDDRAAGSEDEDVHPTWSPTALVAPAAVLAALSVAIGLGAEVLLDLSRTAAQGLVDPAVYIEEVLSR